MTADRRRWIEVGLTGAGPLLLLGLWEVLARSGTVDRRFWPPPSDLWGTTVDLLRDGSLLTDIRASLGRIIVGFVLGTVPALLCGLAMGLFWPVRAFLMPIASAIYAIPKIAIAPLVLIVFGTGETSKYVVVGLSIFFLVLLNTMAGVLAIDRSFRDVARNFGAGPLNLFFSVALPGALPSIFTGVRLGLGFALVVIVGTEYIDAKEGIGRFIFESYSIFAIDKMFVGLIVTGLMGWMLTIGIDVVERWVIPWKPAD